MSNITAERLSPLGEGVSITRHSSGGFTLLHVGWVPVLAAVLMSGIGVLAIGTTEPSLAKRQLVFGVFGMLMAAVMSTPSFSSMTSLPLAMTALPSSPRPLWINAVTKGITSDPGG
jgi:hypothetical protein